MRDQPGDNRRIEYASIDGRPLSLDIYFPALDGTPRPAVVLVHGGGWRRGDRGAMASIAGSLRDSTGAVVVTIDYRVDVFPSGFPAEADDVEAAIRWMRESAGGWDVDPDRIALVGSSSGANIALVAGLRETGPERVVGIVSLSAPVDLVALHAVSGPELNPPEEYLGCDPTECPELYEAASPLTYVSEDDPPVLVVNGRNEEQIPADQATLLDSALRDAGVDSQLVIVDSDHHGRGLVPDVASELDAFLRQTLRIGGSPGTAAPTSEPVAPSVTEDGDDASTDLDPPKDRDDSDDNAAAGAPVAPRDGSGDGGGGGLPSAAVAAIAGVAGLAAGVVIARRGATRQLRARPRTARRRD